MADDKSAEQPSLTPAPAQPAATAGSSAAPTAPGDIFGALPSRPANNEVRKTAVADAGNQVEVFPSRLNTRPSPVRTGDGASGPSLPERPANVPRRIETTPIKPR
jgi:hypothetical protein